MTPLSESKSERTEPSTQELPITPTIQQVKTWDTEDVLRWIQQRDPNILKEGDLDNFKKARISGRVFSVFSFDYFQECALSPGASLVLGSLVDEVKEGKVNSTDVTQTPANRVKGKLSTQTAGRKRKYGQRAHNVIGDETGRS